MDHTEYSAECFKETIQSALYTGFLALGRVQLCMLCLNRCTEYSVRGLPSIIQITLSAMYQIPYKVLCVPCFRQHTEYGATSAWRSMSTMSALFGVAHRALCRLSFRYQTEQTDNRYYHQDHSVCLISYKIQSTLCASFHTSYRALCVPLFKYQTEQTNNRYYQQDHSVCSHSDIIQSTLYSTLLTPHRQLCIVSWDWVTEHSVQLL